MSSGEHLKGEGGGRPRKKGEVGVAKVLRVEETARLVVWGFGVKDIAKRFNVTKVSAQNYIKEAKEKGIIEKFSEARNSQVVEIVAKNLDIVTDTTELLSKRVQEWKKITESGSPDEKKKLPNVATILAVSAHAAKISGTIKEEEKPEVNIGRLQQNILILQDTEKDLLTKMGKVVDISQVERIH